jgi:hypothetical protein
MAGMVATTNTMAIEPFKGCATLGRIRAFINTVVTTVRLSDYRTKALREPCVFAAVLLNGQASYKNWHFAAFITRQKAPARVTL